MKIIEVSFFWSRIEPGTSTLTSIGRRLC